MTPGFSCGRISPIPWENKKKAGNKKTHATSPKFAHTKNWYCFWSPTIVKCQAGGPFFFGIYQTHTTKAPAFTRNIIKYPGVVLNPKKKKTSSSTWIHRGELRKCSKPPVLLILLMSSLKRFLRIELTLNGENAMTPPVPCPLKHPLRLVHRQPKAPRFWYFRNTFDTFHASCVKKKHPKWRKGWKV